MKGKQLSLAPPSAARQNHQDVMATLSSELNYNNRAEGRGEGDINLLLQSVTDNVAVLLN